FDYYKLDAIFISHFHPDHFEIDQFIQAFYVRARKEKREKLSIYGPKGIEKIFTESWNYKHKPGHYPTEFNEDLELGFIELENNKEFNIKGLKVSSYKAKHIYMDAYCFRIEHEGKVIAYSGDSGPAEGLDLSAEEAELFLCESATN